jgi:cobalt-zinc-cadmium efflux system outer membrane protein
MTSKTRGVSVASGHAKMRARPWRLLCWVFFVSMLFASAARAREVVPAPVDIPAILTLDEAMAAFHARGLDLLIAEAAVKNAQGQVDVAGAVPNPSVSGAWGTVLGSYNPNSQPCDGGCSSTYWAVGLSDSSAIEDTLSGKRSLRVNVAKNALAAAKMSRVDAERTVGFEVRSAYLQVAQTALAYDFANEIAESNAKTLALFEARFRSGAINEGDLARIQTQKLESDQALDLAAQTLRQARVALAFLMGVRGRVPDFGVDTKVLAFAERSSLASATEESLLRAAFEHRPDLAAIGYQRASAEAQIDLAKRQRFPDITLAVNYSQLGTGQNALSPPLLTVGLSLPLPVFYQMQGEVRQAEAAYDTASLQQAKTAASVVNDVFTGYAAFDESRKLVRRMEGGGLLKSARVARDVTRLQYEKGAAGLTDFLDAQRSYIATNVEYFQDLASYWTAVFQLEQAVGTELR